MSAVLITGGSREGGNPAMAIAPQPVSQWDLAKKFCMGLWVFGNL